MQDNLSIIEVFEKTEWNPLILNSKTPFTQSFEYGDWQIASGKKVRRFKIEDGLNTLCFFQVIFFPLFSGKKYGYIPYGPVAKECTRELCEIINKECKKIAKQENAVFIRLDFTFENSSEKLLNSIFLKTPTYSFLGSHFQPRYEWVLPLEKKEEEVLEEMHQKTRYSIRLAERKGVEVSIITKDFSNYLEDFYSLISITADRNDFSLHEREYYEKIFQSIEGFDNVILSVATFEKEILAIDFIFIYGNQAMYVFGGSSSEHRNLCASYLAKWKTIQYVKSIGVTIFNFGGVEDPEKKLYNNWEGLTSFKQKFGGHIIKHSDLYDVVYNPFYYFLYNLRKFVKKLV